MTDKQLQKLRKTELLEVLCQIRKELDAAREENAALTERLHSAEDQRALLEEILAAVKGLQPAERQDNG